MLKLDNDFVLFRDHRVNVTTYTFENYLEGLGSQLILSAASEKKEVIYLTKDIPLFHSFCYKALFCLPLFFFSKWIICHPQFVNATFSLNCLPAHIEEAGLRLCKAYNQLPTALKYGIRECKTELLHRLNFTTRQGTSALKVKFTIPLSMHLNTCVCRPKQAEKVYTWRECRKINLLTLRLFHNKTVNNTMRLRRHKIGLYKSTMCWITCTQAMKNFADKWAICSAVLCDDQRLSSRETKAAKFFNILRTRVFRKEIKKITSGSL